MPLKKRWTWKRGKFYVRTEEGLLERSGLICEHFGIHRTITNIGKTWNLTHIPTGLRISPDKHRKHTREEMKMIARVLLNNCSFLGRVSAKKPITKRQSNRVQRTLCILQEKFKNEQ